MDSLTLRDLHEISSDRIAALPGPTRVVSGRNTIAILTPVKPIDMERLKAVLRRAEELNKGRDPAADDAALSKYGEVDPNDWSVEAVRKLLAE